MNHAVQGHPKQIIVKSSDKTWSTGGGNGSPLQYSCCENSMNSMKMQKDTTQKDEPPSSEGVQYATKKVLVLLSCVQLLATPWMVALQAPPSMEFSRQGYWSG